MAAAVKQGWHRHTFDTNPTRTDRTCTVCGARQVKVSGRWTPAVEEPQLDPDITFNIKLPTSLHEQLRELADHNYRTMAAEARLAIAERVERETGDPSPGHSVKVQRGEK